MYCQPVHNEHLSILIAKLVIVICIFFFLVPLALSALVLKIALLD